MSGKRCLAECLAACLAGTVKSEHNPELEALMSDGDASLKRDSRP
jgi:hypothetical protein